MGCLGCGGRFDSPRNRPHHPIHCFTAILQTGQAVSRSSGNGWLNTRWPCQLGLDADWPVCDHSGSSVGLLPLPAGLARRRRKMPGLLCQRRLACPTPPDGSRIAQSLRSCLSGMTGVWGDKSIILNCGVADLLPTAVQKHLSVGAARGQQRPPFIAFAMVANGASGIKNELAWPVNVEPPVAARS
jgi:hypothetical protein